MKIALGLGNPGGPYEKTRHNVGSRVIDVIRASTRGHWREESAELVRLYRDPGGFVLAKPLTFVNDSGRCAKALLDRFAVPPQNLLIVSDELQLGIGRLRLGASGSSGGHNGLQSVIDGLGTEAFPRIRIGIRSERDREIEDLAAFVLGVFDPSDESAVDETVGRAAEAVLVWRDHGIETAMNLYNRKE